MLQSWLVRYMRIDITGKTQTNGEVVENCPDPQTAVSTLFSIFNVDVNELVTVEVRRMNANWNVPTGTL